MGGDTSVVAPQLAAVNTDTWRVPSIQEAAPESPFLVASLVWTH
jgi:hypothetical protein